VSSSVVLHSPHAAAGASALDQGGTGALSDTPGRYLLLAAGLAIIWGAAPLVSEAGIFVVLNLLLLSYLTVECLTERRRNPRRWLMNPAVAASIVTFTISAVVANVVYLIPGSQSYSITVEHLGGDWRFRWLNRAMMYAIVGAAAMWIGFRARVGASAGSLLRERLKRSHLLRGSYKPRLASAIALLGVAVVSRILQIRLGVFGYGADPEQLYAAAPFTQFLSLGAGFSRFVLLALGLALFSRADTSRLTRGLLVFAFGMDIVLGGLLAGFKGGVFFPVIALATTYYWFHSRVKIRFVALGIVLLLLAYAVVEPFRVLRWADPNFDSRSLRSIGNTAVAAATYGRVVSEDAGRATSGLGMLLRVLNRSNFMTFAAISVKYKTEVGELPPDAPRFLRNLVISPVSAFIPRIIWRDKPMQNIGFWFNRRVVEGPGFSAIAMSPFGYLFFAGGGLAVFLGFLAAGALFRLLYEMLRHEPGGVLIYLGMFPSLAIMDSAFDTIFAGTLQSIVVFFVAQRLLFRR
jgi:hypothetical protein